MALPLKSGADLYTQELLRARLHNYDGDLSEYGVGSIYYNTTSGLNTSNRIRYRGLSAWHSVANLEDIARLEGLIADLGDVSGGNITDLLNKIEALEGNFTDGAANDSLKLAGQLPSYYATASGLSALQEKVSAFLDGEADSDAVLENLKEIQAFLDSYDGATSLADMFAAMNTQIADRYTKGEVDTKLSAYRLLTNGVFDVLVNANKGIETDEITIGGIKLSVVDGQLQIDGDVFATGQLASGGIGEAGSGSGASGIVILEDWSKYDDSVAQVVGAVLGKDLHDRLGVAESTIESLVGKATNVSVVQTLTSGKEIGAITIDGVATKLYAPDDYLPLSGGTINGLLTVKRDMVVPFYVINTAESSVASWVALRFGIGTEYKSAIGVDTKKVGLVRFNETLTYAYQILDENNYASVLDNAYLKRNSSETLSRLYIESGFDGKLIFNNNDADTNYTEILFQQNGNTYGRLGTNTNGSLHWNYNLLLNSSNYASFLDKTYLRLSGGTLSRNAETLRLSSPEETNGSTYIGFTTSSNNTVQGYIGYSSSGFMFIQRGEGGTDGSQVVGLDNTGLFAWKDNAAKYFLHAGNFNSYAPTLTGTGASGTWGINVSGTANSLAPESVNDVNNATHSRFFYSGFQASNRPATNYATGLTLYNNLAGYYFQLAYDTSGLMYSRTKPYQGSYSAWKTLAFTDSDITGNAASATKLATARTIWGQSFDGTADVSGDIRLPNYKALQSYTVGGTLRNLVVFNNADKLDIGDANYDTNLMGTKLVFKTGSWKTAMVINSYGNVNVGAVDRATDQYKLVVDGASHVQKVITSNTLGSPSKCFSVGSLQYGLDMWVQDNGSSIIQSHRFDGTAIAYSLCLNPLGGNVGIGTSSPTYKLDVNGTGNFGGGLRTAGQVYATSGFMSGDNGGYGFHSESAWYGLTSIAIGGNRGLQIAGFGGIGVKISQGFSIYPTNNAVNDLGTASNCWRSVFASTSVKIGDATLSWDSTSNALKVDKDFYSDGQVSSGGVAEEGTGSAVGGSGLERVVFTIPANTTTFDCVHNLGTREISVAIYEEGNDYQQILTDVYLDSTNIARVVFGSATDVAHKVVIIG